MQIVIKISDDTYKYWKETKPTTSNIYVIDAIEGIVNGTPLPKGHWSTAVGSMVIKCSVCQESTWYSGRRSYNFCPHCGADMRTE